MTTPRDIIVTPTTHWDREWVQTQIQFQIRLVQLVDRLMDILDKDPAFTCFLFDGQTIPLEDYLAIKPAGRDRLSRLVREGRIIVGPWYVLADQFLEDGESTIRNLVIGFRQSRELGAEPMKVCYVPDSFGCIDSLPMFAAGFGLKYAMFGRGRPSDLPTDKACFRWAGPDGSTVLAANHGYGSGMFLAYPDVWTNLDKAPPDPAAALKIFAGVVGGHSGRENAPVIYLSAGMDHMEARGGLTGVLAHINRHFKDGIARIAGPAAYFEAVERANPELLLYSGEMRGPDVGDFNGCTSSHMELKQANARAQRWLSRYVEPLSTFAALRGHGYPGEFCDRLWRLLIANHPHDSICGCSLDRVHDDMANRYARIEDAAIVFSEQALHAVSAQVDTRHPDPGAVAVVVFNTLGNTRTGLVRQWVRFPCRAGAPFYRLADEEGRTVPARIGTDGRKLKNMDLESLPMTAGQLASVRSKDAPPDRRDDDMFTVMPLEFAAPEVPGLGYRTFWLVPAAAEEGPAPDLHVTQRGMGNRFLELAFNADGTFDLLDRKTGRLYPGLHHFEDTEDIGDAYGYHRYPAAPDVRTTRGTRAMVRVLESLPDRITYRVSIPWLLPEESTREGRLGKLMDMTLTSDITLYSETDHVNIVTSFENVCRDHRLRAIFEGDIRATHSVAEGNFSLVRRPVPTPEKSMHGYPQQSFAMLADGDGGLAVLNHGLPEFEAVRTDHGTRLCLTLLRAVGELGPPAGANHPVPGAQCPGRRSLSYAVRPVRSNESEADVLRAALGFTTPLAADGASQHEGQLPVQGSFVKVEGPVVVTALKKAERDDDIVIRFWNPEPAAATMNLATTPGIARASITSLNEDPIKDLPVTDGAVACTVPARGLTTVKFTPG